MRLLLLLSKRLKVMMTTTISQHRLTAWPMIEMTGALTRRTASVTMGEPDGELEDLGMTKNQKASLDAELDLEESDDTYDDSFVSQNLDFERGARACR